MKIISFSSANKTKGFSSRYINDFNASSSFEPFYDYDNTKTEVDKVSLQQDLTKNEENLDVLYPNPEDIKSRMEHHEESVIKICKFYKVE